MRPAIHCLELCRDRAPMKNVSREREDRDYRAYYTDDTRELVHRYFIKDINLFGHDFDDFERSIRPRHLAP